MVVGFAIVGMALFFWGAFWNRPKITQTGAIVFLAAVVAAVLLPR